jgi:hypothetical protein
MAAFEPLPEEVKPASKEEEAKRAFFFTRELEFRSWEAVIQNLGFFLPARPHTDVIIEESALDQKKALKIMTWACIWCTAIECGGIEMQPWLLDFFTTAMRIADDRQSEERSRALLIEMGGLKDAPLRLRVAESVAACGSGINAEDLGGRVSEFLSQSQTARLDLLRAALLLPLDSVRDMIQLIEHVPTNARM